MSGSRRAHGETAVSPKAAEVSGRGRLSTAPTDPWLRATLAARFEYIGASREAGE